MPPMRDPEAWEGSMEGPAFYRHTRKGYDDLAPTYDREIGANPIGIRMREIFRETLTEALPSSGLVFEIGCGSGIDALWLARKGFQVVATDISEGMVRQVSRKAREAGLADRVVARRLAAHEIGTLTAEFGEGAFDGGYSHAGALNMEPNLATTPPQVSRLLRPQASFTCSVINRSSLFELLFYPFVLRPRKAFRRLGNVIPLPISREPPLNRHVVPARFYAPAELIDLFEPWLQVVRFRGLQVFLPPPNLAEEYNRAKPLLEPMRWLEERVAERWPFRHLGHHTIFVLRRP